MKNRKRIILELVAFACALILLIISAIPLWSKETDGQVLALIAGSFGVGVMLHKFVQMIRTAKKK
jgi:hypothetical protein